MRRLPLSDVVGWAWVLVLLAALVVPGIGRDDPPVYLRVAMLVVLPVGLLALPVAVVGSLILLGRRLSDPGPEQAADYDDRGPPSGGDPP